MKKNDVFKTALKWYQSSCPEAIDAAKALFTEEELRSGVSHAQECMMKAKNRSAKKKLDEYREMYPVGTLVRYAGSYALVESKPVYDPSSYNGFRMFVRFINGGCTLIDHTDKIPLGYIGYSLPEIATVDEEYKDRLDDVTGRVANLQFNISHAKEDIANWEKRVSELEEYLKNAKKIDLDELRKQL